jgi:hypothetical protein
MLALDPVVVDAVWASFAAYLPEHSESRPPDLNRAATF